MGHHIIRIAATVHGIVLSCFIALLATVNAFADTQRVSDPYYSLIYDFEVAQFCGLVSKTVYDAFWAKRKIIEKHSPRSTEELRKTRISAMAAADLEYSNRGLGGYKPWCQNEGRTGTERITNP